MTQPKILVITAIFGGMERPKPFAAQSVECDYKCITPENSPFPLPNLPPRLQAKYFKLQAHRIWPDYQYFVWIDGNIEAKSPDFVKKILGFDDGVSGISGEIAIQRHHERKTIKEEIDLITASENPYLTVRYGAQPLRQEYEWYLTAGMLESAPLFACNIFAYHKTIGTERFFDRWWALCLKWSWFDQSAFSYLASLVSAVRVVNFGPMFDNPYFTLHPHDNWQQ